MTSDTLPFSDLVSNIVDNRGRTCPTVETGIPLIATNCISNDALYPTYEKVRYVSEETYDNWFRGHPKPGDLIFVTKGSPGRVCMAPDPVDFCIAQDMVAVRADSEKIYPRYLFAVLRSDAVQRTIENMHVGTLIPHFKKGDFNKLFLPVPDRAIQEAIGDLYFELSAKIDLNQKANETLEAVARAIFKSWFVDFDPVCAKANGESSKSACRRLGLNPDLLTLFPDRLVDSELGKIPEGWPVRSVGDVVQIVGGSTPSTKTPEYWEEGAINWVTPKDLSGLNAPVLLNTERKITELGLKQISSGVLPPGTVLMSSRAPIGYLAISEVPVAINQGFIAILSEEPLSAYYMHQWCHFNMELIKQRAGGTTFAEISKGSFRPIPFIFPNAKVLHSFSDIGKPLYGLIAHFCRESYALDSIRSSLLPKLISGELRVPLIEE